MVSQIAEYNFAIYFLPNALWNMNFGPILTNLEPFIDRVPEKAKTIIMNMGIKIPLIFDKLPEFLICCRGSPTL